MQLSSPAVDRAAESLEAFARSVPKPEGVSVVLVRALCDLVRDRAPTLLFPELEHRLTSSGSEAVLARRDYVRLLKRMARELDDPHFAVAVGAELQPSHLHIVGPLIMATATPRAALEVASELAGSLLRSARWRVSVRDGLARIEYAGANDAAGRIEADLYVATIFHHCLRYWGPQVRRELRAEFRYPAPEANRHHDALFGECARFEQPTYGVTFPERMLDLPRRAFDASFAASLLEFARDTYLGRAPSLEATILKVRAELASQNLEGVTSEDVARRMGISARTLRRQLARERTTFRRVLESVRFERAVQLLQTTTKGTKAIAHEVGYTEVKAFVRAFRRVHGETPSVFAKRRPRSGHGRSEHAA